MPIEAENIWDKEALLFPASKNKHKRNSGENLASLSVQPPDSPKYKGEIRQSPLDRLEIVGGHRLYGTIPISGAKNSALKLMCASLLTSDTLQLGNMPLTLADMKTTSVLLSHIGVKIRARKDDKALLTADKIINPVAPYDLVRKMRAGILVLGPLLARHGYAEVSLPGGCAIGTRPVDFHIEGLRAMGAEIEIERGYIKAKTTGNNGLKGGIYRFPKASHTGTENLMMAASLADGVTILENAAKEPEICDLARLLNKMGAKISGHGTDKITIEGVSSLHGTSHDAMPDRIETGTWMIAAAMTGSKLCLRNAGIDTLDSLIPQIIKAGADISLDGDSVTVTGDRVGKIKAIDIMTEPYPGFPTDLQAQIMAMLCGCEGAGMITETIWENRFMHVPELCRMGADITVQGNSAIIRGVNRLKAAEVMATDLRASVALVLAALVADGVTSVNRIYHLDRGYENIVEKLGNCGAEIRRIQGTS